MPNQDDFELRWILGVIRRRIWLILIFTLLAGGAAYALIASTPPEYESTTTLLVAPGQDEKAGEYSSLVAGERLALTYAQMLKGRPVLEQVIQELGLSLTADKLAARITTETIQDTQLIRLTVTASSPEEAASLADAISEVFIQQTHEQALAPFTTTLASLQEQIDTLSSLIDETLVKVDSLRAQKTEQETQMRKLENQLAQYHSDYRDNQQEYQSLQLAVAQLTDNVKIIDPAQIPDGRALLPFNASVTLLIDQATVAREGDYSAILASERLAQTYAEMLESGTILEAALAQLDLEESPEWLANKVKAEPIPDTQLLRLSVTDFNPSQAVLLANTITEVFIKQIQAILAEPYDGRLTNYEDQLAELSQQIEETQSEIDTLNTEWVHSETELARLEGLLEDYRSDHRTLLDEYKGQQLLADDTTRKVSIVEKASVSLEPVQRNNLYIILAAIVGAMGGLGFAFLMEYLDDTLKTAEDISQALGLETLGTIGRHSKTEEGLVVIAKPLSPAAEAFRGLANNIRHAGLEGSLRTLMVTSASSKEGKSFTVANLAATFARSNLNVVVVDADLRLSTLHKLFGVDQAEGLVASLNEGVMDGRLQDTGIERLSVLPSGEPPANPAELVNSPQMRKLLDEMVKIADVVLIDCPPVLPVADTKILASQVDGVLIVVRAGSTRARSAKETIVNLRQAGANLVGVVLNAAPERQDRYYQYYQSDTEKSKSPLKRRN